MKFVPNAVSRKVSRQILVGKKNSPAILLGVGVAGVVTATVMACKATLKLEEVIEETQHDLDKANNLEHRDYSEEDRTKDKAVIYTQAGIKLVKLYGPAVIVGTLSVSALIGSHKILSKRNAALTAAYAALEAGFEQYRKRVVEEYGEEKDREFRYGAETRTVLEDDGKGAKKVTKKTVAPGDPSIYARFFDEYCSSWQRNPEYNFIFLRAQQNYANDMLQSRGHVFLNDVYDMLGIDRSQAGAVVGWVVSKDGDNYVDFGVFDGNNPKARDFVNGREGSILLDFNVDGVIYDKI